MRDPTGPTLTFTRLAGPVHDADGAALLVVGPSLGTSAEALWGDAARRLGDRWDVVGWDLPGHGRSPATTEPFTVADLAAVVRRTAAEHADGRPVRYAGVSLGGAVALELAREPGPFVAVASLASAAVLGTPESWRERAELVRRAGTSALVESSAERWFTPRFLERDPAAADRLLRALGAADAESYALACEALAGHDLRGRLGEVRVPLLVGPGEHDGVVAPRHAFATTADAPGATHHVFTGCAHQPPVEDPAAVAAVLRWFAPVTSPAGGSAGLHDTYEAGMAVRRAVLGDAHVDRAQERTTALTRDFQELITRYAWGSVWTRPGLARRERSIAVLTALIALGHWDELAMHVRAAVTNGLTAEEIGEVVLQAGVYCGVPAANHAFAVAQRVLEELENDARDH